MITIICGAPGAGKTALNTAFACNTIMDRERYLNCVAKIKELDNMGYHILSPKREHCVACNYDVFCFNKYCSGKKAYKFNPYKFVLPNDEIDYEVVYPYFSYHITEGQAVYDSRKSKTFKDCCSRLFENHRHNHLDIFIDCQRNTLIDLNIRGIAQFIYIIDCKVVGDKTYWTGFKFNSLSGIDNYINSGKPRDCAKFEYEFDGDIFEHFDSFENEKAFYNFDKRKLVSIDEYSEKNEQKSDFLLVSNNFRGNYNEKQ